MAALSSHVAASSPGSSYTGGGSIEDGIFSRQDYFSSRAGTSISGSDHMLDVKHYEVPDPPVKLKSGSVFDCSYCGQEIIFGLQVASNDEWNAHVLLDLEPYLCTFDDCLRGQRSFRNQEDWWQHELINHRLKKIWVCQSCNHVFDKAKGIESHLKETHKLSEDPEQLALMVSVCEKYSENGQEYQSCDLCGSSPGTTKALRDHMADHMQQLALSCIEAVWGPVLGSSKREEGLSEEQTKLEFLNKFVVEQRGLFWRPTRETKEEDSGGSNVAFAEDSDDEIISQKFNFPVAEEIASKPMQRPGMGRRGNSWMKKINSFLETQPKDQQITEQSLPFAAVSLENQPLPSSDFGNDQEGPPFCPPKRVMTDQEIAVVTRPHCLRTRPPPRNKDFVGRDSDFLKLHTALSTGGASVILSGIGGIGKTDTAIEYTYRFDSEYSYIFWVSAETPIACADSYSVIATEFIITEDNSAYGQDRLISLGREFLEQTDKKWLLVFDNACSWSNLQVYIPLHLQHTSGSILITARAPDLAYVPESFDCLFFEMNPLTLEESRLFLLKSMSPDLKIEEVQKHPEYSLAGAVATEAAGLPLALSHIAGYIQVSACTLTDFVQLWNERRRHKNLKVPSTEPSSASTNKTLERVWNIGLREVTMDARELLNILAFLDCDHIQRQLLVGDHEQPSLEFLHSDQSFRYISCSSYGRHPEHELILFKDTKG